jgi:predicted nucleic acid-binding protein
MYKPMNYVIELLTTELEVLDNTYEKFVVQGKVDKNSLSATKNREKAKSLREAIELLNQNK